MRAVTKFYRQRKLRINKAMGGKCAICGYDKCAQALEMHHINPEEKEFGFGETNKYRTWEELVPEMKKCVLLCANCHREIHAAEELVELQSSFNEAISNEIAQEIQDEKTKTIYYCIDCGKQISYKATRCQKCAELHNRRAERPSREDLKHMIRTMPFTKIGEQYDVTDNTIRKWCDAVNLPRRVKDIKSYSDEEWEKI